jgi:hypothetical protein
MFKFKPPIPNTRKGPAHPAQWPVYIYKYMILFIYIGMQPLCRPPAHPAQWSTHYGHHYAAIVQPCTPLIAQWILYIKH